MIRFFLAIFHTSWVHGGCGKLQKVEKIAPGGLWKRLYKRVIFSENLNQFVKKSQKKQKKYLSPKKIKKLLPGTYILIYVL